ncbi:MAG: lysine--tRNA ligase, partial [Malacoplasma sp.]|nr:lysine--tRNA ligase [Malacoplasma sp.]
MDSRKFNDQETIRRNKLAQLQKDNKDPFAIEKFDRNHTSASFIKKYEQFSKEELHENQDEIIIAGRIMAIRQTFGVIKD